MMGINQKLEMPFEIDDKLCTGCMACICACSVNAIEIVQNDEGFSFPRYDSDKCIDCGRCKSACPMQNKSCYVKHRLEDADGEIAVLRDEKNLLNSASGGAFYGISSHVISSGGVVYGAAFDDQFVVKHQRTDTIAELEAMQNSKYVQSDVGLIFREVLGDLKAGKECLFSGTPCQIAGLYGFLKRDYENLITMEIICHGVPSPKLLEAEIKNRTKGKKDLEKIRFRTKSNRTKSHYILSFRFSNQKQKLYDKKHDLYYYLFSSGSAARESCYCCEYASSNRIADFTIGDNDSWREYGDFHADTSNSVVMIHTEKAERLWKECRHLFDFRSLDVPKEAGCNKHLTRPCERPALRDEIYQAITSEGWENVSQKYCAAGNKFQEWTLKLKVTMPARLLHLLVAARKKVYRKH